MNPRALLVFACGVAFALALGIARMTRPEVVLGFLDVTGRWDPRLAVMMPFAVLAYRGFDALARRRARPVLAPAFEPQTKRPVDARLLAGAAIFGIGWGLVGLCPAPALIGAVANRSAALFVGALAAGIVLADLFGGRADDDPQSCG